MPSSQLQKQGGTLFRQTISGDSIIPQISVRTAVQPDTGNTVVPRKHNPTWTPAAKPRTRLINEDIHLDCEQYIDDNFF